MEGVLIIYISQGNIPSKWAHTFQAMKMAQALAEHADLLLLTGGSLLPPVSTVDLAQWYGISRPFPILRLPVHWRLQEPFFAGVRYPQFDRVAALYARLKAPNLVFTRSPYAGYLCAKLRLNTIVETHIDTNHSQFQHLLATCGSPHWRGVVTVTDYLKRQYLQAGVPEDKILVWSDAVEPSLFSELPSQEALRQELGLPLERKIATYCGHFYPSKGVDHVIRAAKELPHVWFCLVGGWQKDIERCQSQAQGLHNVHFAGFVSNQQVPKYLAAADLLLLPNSMRHKLAYATSPLKLFEYMAAQRPVIAAAIPALEGFLRHQENAYLVEPDSGQAIASAVQTLIHNPDLAARMVEQAWQEVQQYTWSRRAQGILAHFSLN